jgi:hypothetical protein
MGPRARDLPDDFEREFNRRLFVGNAFFARHGDVEQDKAEAQEVARRLREDLVPAYVAVIPRSRTYPDRVLLYTPARLLEAERVAYERLEAAAKQAATDPSKTFWYGLLGASG